MPREPRIAVLLVALCLPGCGGTIEPREDGGLDAGADGAADAPDQDASNDAEAGGADADEPACDPGERRCAGGALETCGLSGWSSESCRSGCLASPEPRCASFAPSNLAPDLLVAGTGPLAPGAGSWTEDVSTVQIDSDSGRIVVQSAAGLATLRPPGEGRDPSSGIAFTVVAQPDGAPAIGVFSVYFATVPAGVAVWVSGANAFALASAGPVVVAGVVNVKAYTDGSTGARLPGPGGAARGAGPGAGTDGRPNADDRRDGGGGGAGFGGRGGGSGPDDLGGAGGETYGSPGLSPLFGGSGGGRGWDAPGQGGPGGGACEIVSAESIVVEAGGGIDAAGHGGEGAEPRGGGGGGGSGGAILLEAPALTVRGVLAANGGGGGSGARDPTAPGVDGERGSLSAVPAPGGTLSFAIELGCDGGAGSAGELAAGSDTVCEPSDEDGGGGGGGAGRIRLNGLVVDLSAGLLSPALSTGAASTGELPVE